MVGVADVAPEVGGWDSLSLDLYVRECAMTGTDGAGEAEKGAKPLVVKGMASSEEGTTNKQPHKLVEKQSTYK